MAVVLAVSRRCRRRRARWLAKGGWSRWAKVRRWSETTVAGQGSEDPRCGAPRARDNK
ncbi:hypothetical protein GOBAR_DD13387 [Gossypium barbadense]|nr:hypothetical protein GOBAR_DD13387 [Gossypium barbadense]